jgi:hypothetical protein
MTRRLRLKVPLVKMTVLLPEDLKDAVRRRAEEEGRSQSVVVEEAFRRALGRPGGGRGKPAARVRNRWGPYPNPNLRGPLRRQSTVYLDPAVADRLRREAVRRGCTLYDLAAELLRQYII